MTRVLPEPGPARIRLEPSGAVAAARCGSFRSRAKCSRSRSSADFWRRIFRMATILRTWPEHPGRDTMATMEADPAATIIREPKVYLVGRQTIDEAEMARFL